MSSKIFAVFTFAAGAAIGSAVTWKLLKTKYEQIAREEIDSVKEVFSRRYEKASEEPDEMTEMKDLIDECGYAKETDKEEKGGLTMDNKPYIISPDEFGESDYETVSLIYYADGVLTNFMDDSVQDIEEVIGSECLDHFGDYEEDSIFVRNDELEVDYEVLLDERTHAEAKEDEGPKKVTE